MDIYTQDYPLSGAGNISFRPRAEQQRDVNPKDAFGAIFNAAMGLLNETNNIQKSAEALQLDLAAGRTDDILSVLLAQEKAYSSLNFTVQVTNKLIEGYREIMRMQL